MATSYYDADDYYFVKSVSNELIISAQLGNEMNGGFFIFHGDHLLSSNVAVTLLQKDFSDDWVTVTVVIKDKQERLSWASVVISLQEDSQIPKTFGPYRRKMETGIDTVCFTVKIKIRK